jgi:hypothetical protein
MIVRKIKLLPSTAVSISVLCRLYSSRSRYLGVLKVAVDAKELNAQLNDIRKTLDAGKMPYEQLKAYAAYCARSGKSNKELKQVRIYIDNILRAEEDAAISTSTQMKEILACLG